MLIEDSVHYKLNSAFDPEWNALVPSYAFKTSNDNGPFTITLFHQLHCLNILRIDFAKLMNDTHDLSGDPSLRKHCLNYLRQTALCHGDLHIEPITEAGNTERTHEYMCRDWTLIYDAVESVYR
ncbi:hypothetical protein BDY19DRAFT_916741 [Irpex rosettiformis]|uniref:Uncharacterized protein n=1 Tax=Irpex rosettiformis TaxID=378272 RepID=A0ACB8ULW1_9APHY|nr:hypothetical protein BDY19DRAFT_916741 [Irpex rosettiformis]